jgi:hypothetical protein
MPAEPLKKPKRTFSQKWRLVSVNNKMVVYFTGVIAMATVLYTLFAGWQLSEIHKGSKDTHDLAVAAGKQADAAKVQSEQAKAQTDKMAEQVEALKKTADAAKVSAGAAQVALQPAVGVQLVVSALTDTSLKYEIQVRNEGGSPTKVTLRYCALLGTAAFIPTLKNCPNSKVKIVGPETVLPHSTFPTSVIAPNIAEVRTEQVHFFTPLTVEYTVLGKQRTDSRCFVYREMFKSIGECSDILETQP